MPMGDDHRALGRARRCKRRSELWAALTSRYPRPQEAPTRGLRARPPPCRPGPAGDMLREGPGHRALLGGGFPSGNKRYGRDMWLRPCTPPLTPRCPPAVSRGQPPVPCPLVPERLKIRVTHAVAINAGAGRAETRVTLGGAVVDLMERSPVQNKTRMSPRPCGSRASARHDAGLSHAYGHHGGASARESRPIPGALLRAEWVPG
jgi:hypothetical protein